MIKHYFLSFDTEEPIFNPNIHPVYLHFPQEKVRGLNSRLYCFSAESENEILKSIADDYPYLYGNLTTGETLAEFKLYPIPEGDEPPGLQRARTGIWDEDIIWRYDYEDGDYGLSDADSMFIHHQNVFHMRPLAGEVGHFISKTVAVFVEDLGYITQEMYDDMREQCSQCDTHFFPETDETICSTCITELCANFDRCGNLSGDAEYCGTCSTNEVFRPDAVFIDANHPSYVHDIIDGWHSASRNSFRKHLAEEENDNNPTYGCEVEVESRFHGNVKTANSLKLNIFDPLNVPIKYCRDGTIAANQGIELISDVYDFGMLMHSGQGRNFFEAFDRTLTYAYGKHGQNNGLHIHVGLLDWRSEFNLQRLERLLHFHSEYQELIEFIAERGQTSHWKHIEIGEVSETMHRFRNGSNASRRYKAVNINAHDRMGTIEFRYFKTNLSTKGFKKNIQWMDAIMQYCKEVRLTTIYQYIAIHSAIYPELYHFMEDLPDMAGLIPQNGITRDVNNDVDDIITEVIGGNGNQIDIYDVLSEIDDVIERMEGGA